MRRTWAGVKCALSTAMVVVAPLTSESPPPMMPPKPCVRAASAMTSMSADAVRVTPSSVLTGSPGAARRARSSVWASRARS